MEGVLFGGVGNWDVLIADGADGTGAGAGAATDGEALGGVE